MDGGAPHRPTAELLRLAPCVYLPGFVYTLGDYFTAPVLSLVAVELSGSGAGAAGTVAAAGGLAAMVAQVPAAAIYSRIGPRTTLALATAVSALGTLGCAGAVIAQSFAAFVLATALMGAGQALMYVARTAYTRELAPAWLRGRACAMEGGVSRFASILAPLLGGRIATTFGSAGPFALGGLVKLVGAALFLLGPRRLQQHVGEVKAKPEPAGDEQKEKEQQEEKGGGGSVSWGRIVVEQRSFFSGACVAICLLTVLRQALNLMVPLLGQHIGLSVQQIGAAYVSPPLRSVLREGRVRLRACVRADGRQSAGNTVDSVMFLP